MKNFLVRLTSGVIVAALVIAAILYSPLTYGVVILLAVIGGVYEFQTITAVACNVTDNKGRKGVVTLAGIAVLISLLFDFRGFRFVDVALVLPAILFFYFIKELFSKSDHPFQNIGWKILPFIYIVLPVLLYNWLYFDKGALFALALVFLIWFYDSMCYICGSLLGKRKLFERISPQKTWEGLIGGMILTLVLAFFYDKILGFLCTRFHFHAESYSNIEWLIIGFVTLVTATFGDLVESMLKRSLQIKDSGSFLPGHGGMLDRLDAILVALPFAVLTIWLIDRVGDVMLLIDFLK